MRAISHIPLRPKRRTPRRLVSLLSLLLFSLASDASFANTFTVTNLNDSGAGSLRQAISGSNANPGADSIVFANGLTGTIALTSALPNLTDDVTLSGSGAKLLTIARSSATGTPAFRILTIDNGTATPPTVSISGLTLANGLILPTITGNYYGGAVLSNKANVTFTDCAISGNSISLPNPNPFPPPNGMLYPGHDNYNYTFGFGGGIYNYQGVMTLTRCTLSNNITNSAGSQAKGGGLLNDAGTLTLTNCTLSGNQAVTYANTHYYGGLGGYPTYTNGSAWGGAISNNGTLNLIGCTFAGNITINHNIRFGPEGWGISYDAAGVGSSVYNDGASSSTHINIYQTILASGSAAGGSNIVNASGIVLTSLGYNLSNDATGPNDGATDLLNMDAKLSPLNYYGGSTPTCVPLLGSPAVDAGDPNFNNTPPATDQRGQPRVVNGRVDIGAVERQVGELVASDDAYSIKHDHTLRVAASGVLTNDTGVASLSAVLVASAAHGTLLLNGDGSFVYTPNASYGLGTNSADSFTYAVQDGSGRTSNLATVTITVLADNPPQLTNSLSATTMPGQAWRFTATATDADLPDDTLTFALVNAPSGMSINASTGAITWTPQAESTTSFNIKVTDLYGKSDTKTFALTVYDNPPSLTSGLTGTATAGQAWNVTATATDADLPNDTLTFALVNAPSGMNINAASGVIAWTPKAEGVFTFDIRVTDRFGKSDQKTFTLTVQSDPNGAASLSITNVVVQRVYPNKIVSFNVVNNGAGKATNFVITRATLGPWLGVVLNPTPVTLAAGGKRGYILLFSEVTTLPTVIYPLQIRGTYQSQNVAQSLFYGGGVFVP